MVVKLLNPAASAALWLVVSSTVGATTVATAPQLVDGTINMFRDWRGANSVGNSAGDVIQYGANIVGGSVGTLISATAANGFFDPAAPCAPLTVSPNFCANGTPYNAMRLDPWQIQFSRNGLSTTVTGPSLVGVQRVPFPTSVTMAGTGLTPTISWALPAGLAPDGFRVQIFDKNRKLANGVSDIIYTQQLAANATSFALPSGLGLSTSGSYAINLQVIETRGHVAFTGNNAQIFSRSSAFFDFTPLSGDVPSDIALPTIDASGVYNFHVDSVGADHITFIDPVVATGYHYAVGATGPNFQSLLLPDVGDGVFTLDYSDAGGAHHSSLLKGQQFFFGQGGVAAFTVGGIETSAMLDPGNGTAFITGLTFAASGEFTGTMTPITVSVPEPQSWALMLGGLCAVAWVRRLQQRA